MADMFDIEEVKFLINKWYLWKGVAIGSFLTLIALTTIGLLFGR